MKLFIIVILATICGSAMCGQAERMEMKKQCAEKLNVKPEDVKEAFYGRTKEADVIQDIKCFFLCMGEKQKIIKDGTFQSQIFIESVSSAPDKDAVTKAAAECNVKGADDCETGYKVARCIAKNEMHKFM